MATYVRKDGDVKYRRVSIQTEMLPPFEDFTAAGEVISYLPAQVVEVLRSDGTTALFHDEPVMKANYQISAVNKILIAKDVPLARVWVRKIDNDRVCYKVPSTLPVVGGGMEFRVSGSAQGMELFGDKYFEMVYHF